MGFGVDNSRGNQFGVFRSSSELVFELFSNRCNLVPEAFSKVQTKGKFRQSALGGMRSSFITGNGSNASGRLTINLPNHTSSLAISSP
jgi:hypothetical protein